MFSSEQECLDAFEQPPESETLGCIKAILQESGLDEEGRVEAVECYNDATVRLTDCYVRNGECSQVGVQQCSESDLTVQSRCQGELTADEVEAMERCLAD